MDMAKQRVVQIQQCHQEAKGDFSLLVKRLRELAIDRFSTQTTNLQSLYQFRDQQTVIIDSDVEPIEIAAISDVEQFLIVLKQHQVGELDFMQWRERIAQYGADYWLVDLIKQQCQYFDSEDKLIHTETFPVK